MNAHTVKRLMRRVGGMLARTNIDRACRCMLSVRDMIYTGYVGRKFARMGEGTVFCWRAYTLVGQEYIRIGENSIFEKGIQLTARKTDCMEPEITIGGNCLIRACAHITAVNSIKIGNNLLTGTNVLITDNMHGDTEYVTLMTPPRDRKNVSGGKVVIGNNVWLGNNVCIMPGVTIGDGVVIGANSVVTHDVPEYSVACGVPAVILKGRIPVE